MTNLITYGAFRNFYIPLNLLFKGVARHEPYKPSLCQLQFQFPEACNCWYYDHYAVRVRTWAEGRMAGARQQNEAFKLQGWAHKWVLYSLQQCYGVCHIIIVYEFNSTIDQKRIQKITFRSLKFQYFSFLHPNYVLHLAFRLNNFMKLLRYIRIMFFT